MKIPEKCPKKKDSVFPILNLLRGIISMIILYLFHWIVMLGYMVFWIILNFIFLNKFVCSICIYKKGGEYETIEDYNNDYKVIFHKRMGIVLRLQLIDWFLAAIIGMIIILYQYIINFPQLVVGDSLIFLILIPSMILLLITTQAVIRRIPNKFCKICKYREHGPNAQRINRR